MATSLVVNGVSYLYPDTGDQSWGTVASAWAAAVTSGMLQKAGGTFTLTADANFGANFGLISAYFTSQAANAASAGVVRLASTDTIKWRNNANGADVALGKNTSDQLTWAGVAIVSSSGTVLVSGGGTGITSGTSGGILGFTASGTIASSALLAASQVVIGGGAGATPTTLSAGTQYQVLTMGASNPGYGAVNLAQAAAVTGILPNGNTTAASANTASAIVARDGSGNFTAGTITAALTGNVTGTASGNTTYTANNHGVVLSGSANTMTVIAPDSSTTKVLVSGGASADPAWGNGGVSTATASSLAFRDANANVRFNNVIENFATTATNAATTTLTVSSAQVQQFTGSTTQTVVLPDATTLVVGQSFTVCNRSSGVVTVNANGGSLVQSMGAGSQCTFTVTSIGTSTGVWDSAISFTSGSGSGSVTSVGLTVPTALFATSPVSGSPITTSGTLAPTLATQTARTFFQGPQSGSAATPTFTALQVPTIQKFTTTGTTTGYLFTISTSSTVAVGDTYTNNGNTYTVLGALTAQSGAVLFTSQAAAPAASGNLLKATGSGTGTIAFTSSVVLATYTPPTNPAPLYIRIRGAGGGAGGQGSGTTSGRGGGNAGLTTYFGANIISAPGGAAASGSTANPGGVGGAAPSLGTSVGVTFKGGDGAGIMDNLSTGAYLLGGYGGGSSLFNGAGAGGTVAGAGINASANTGGGGGGGGVNTTASAIAGGGGGGGGSFDSILTTMATSFPYRIGTGGTHGGAGASGGAIGGDGADGILEITEYYQ